MYDYRHACEEEKWPKEPLNIGSKEKKRRKKGGKKEEKKEKSPLQITTHTVLPETPPSPETRLGVGLNLCPTIHTDDNNIVCPV